MFCYLAIDNLKKCYKKDRYMLLRLCLLSIFYLSEFVDIAATIVSFIVIQFCWYIHC